MESEQSIRMYRAVWPDGLPGREPPQWAKEVLDLSRRLDALEAAGKGREVCDHQWSGTPRSLDDPPPFCVKCGVSKMTPEAPADIGATELRDARAEVGRLRAVIQAEIDHLADGTKYSTHYAGCEQVHPRCKAIARLRAALSGGGA